jgi:hypothetical protein
VILRTSLELEREEDLANGKILKDLGFRASGVLPGNMQTRWP